MKFELKPDTRNTTDEELVEDLLKIVNQLNKKTITAKEYGKHGKFSESTLRRRFNGWTKTLERANLKPTKDYSVTKKELLEELQRIYNLQEVDRLSREAYTKYKKISSIDTIQRVFGSWTNALKEAKIPISGIQNRYTNNELFENMLNVWSHLGKQPTITNISEYPSTISSKPYTERFGGYRKALEAFIEYMNQDEPIILPKEESKPKKLPVNTIQHKTSRTPNSRLRWKVLNRDNHTCQSCGKSPANQLGTTLHIDHIYPWSKGGETVIENLQLLCSDCNLGKSNLT